MIKVDLSPETITVSGGRFMKNSGFDRIKQINTEKNIFLLMVDSLQNILSLQENSGKFKVG